MIDLSRLNRGPLGRWWWTIDRWILLAVTLLMGAGVVLILSASPSVAQRQEWGSLYFIKKHLFLIVPCWAGVVGISFLSVKQVRFLGWILVLSGFLLLFGTFLTGPIIKGARRWLIFFGFSIQASELIKPGLAIVWGWLLTHRTIQHQLFGKWISLILYLGTMFFLYRQPDVGQGLLITGTLLCQLFLAGMSWVGIMSLGGMSVLGLGVAYYTLPHVQRRLDLFFNPGLADRFGDQFQIFQSLEAFGNGGLWGQGPGEGTIKSYLPDAHSDFIFAVAGEEFGLVFCSVLIFLYSFIIARCFLQLFYSQDLFIIVTATGIVVQLGLQALINLSSTLNLIPPKGMTLPLVSYGGSSLIAVSLSMGVLLSLMRKNYLGEV